VPDRRRYRKPLVAFEFGTRIYAPSEAERRYRIIAKDPSGGRVFQKLASEDEARARARQLEAMLASSVILPGRGSAPTTVAELTELYAASLGSRSTRYAERQESLLRHWVTPVIGDRPLVGWTPADSERVLDRARQRLAPATVQNVGSCMRALVTFAYKNRWLARESDPMWLVRYSARPDVQGQAVGFIHRASLPTDQDCQRLFDALESLDQPVWALAMRLKHRSGARWGELIALRPVDLDFEPQRVVRIHRAVEQSARGMSIKTTKNRQQRVSTFPTSLVADLRNAQRPRVRFYLARRFGVCHDA
jgi:integrase